MSYELRGPLVVSAPRSADLEHAIASLLDRAPGSRSTGTLWRVPVCYDGEFAPDLAEVARLTGLSPGEVVALHSGTRYHVYMLGFLPGFPYMGNLPARLALPHKGFHREIGNFAGASLAIRRIVDIEV